MKRTLILIATILLIASTGWSTGDLDPVLLQKLDPSLIREFGMLSQPISITGTGRPFQKETALLKPQDRMPSEPERLVNVTKTRLGNDEFLNVMIHLREDKDVKTLKNLGIRVNTLSGGWATALIPKEDLVGLLRRPEVLYIHASKPVLPCMDVSVPATRASELHAPSSVKGQGVLVGIVDSGIDWTHEDFKKPDGTSRIRYIWDQEDTVGPNPSGFSYGTEWTKAQIDVGNCRETDTNTHGTHVAGTVAGDGSATGNGQPANRFVGMAPEAEIVFVKYSDDENSIVDGVSYIFQRAEALGKPVSVNISLATQRGPHDGTYPQDAALNNLVGSGKPGKILCIAASNEGYSQYPIHAGATLATPDRGNDLYPYTAHRPWSNQQFFIAEVWYPAGQTVNLRL
ncbi:MAG TPA: S8 family serine peptidase, partial [bacterium]|nr:S8 family serine peptidase [bacterium]